MPVIVSLNFPRILQDGDISFQSQIIIIIKIIAITTTNNNNNQIYILFQVL